jgi:hypothetical protein
MKHPAIRNPFFKTLQSRKKVRRTLLLGNSQEKKKVQTLSSGRTRKSLSSRI